MSVSRTSAFFLLPILLLLARGLSAQTHSGLVYANASGQNLLLDLYLPAGPGPHPTVIWLHSGGFTKNDRTEAQADAPTLVASGFAVASIDYRLSSVAQWPAQIHDAKAAVRWLRGNAAKYGLDPERFASFGFSAGPCSPRCSGRPVVRVSTRARSAATSANRAACSARPPSPPLRTSSPSRATSGPRPGRRSCSARLSATSTTTARTRAGSSGWSSHARSTPGSSRATTTDLSSLGTAATTR
jgi:hypothetical protein